ncbi:MAG TPA: hypothetical protein VIK68_06600 [Sphingomicrobium sp.]
MKAMFALLAFCLFLLVAPAAAQQQPKPLFAASEPIHITIHAPLSKLINDRTTNTAVAGTLTDPSGQLLPIAVTLRGHVNRLAETCEFPPLRVEFTTPPPSTSVFAGQKKLKLMTHCHSGSSAQQYLLLHYATYQMYNLLTPLSFRARLASVDYRDAGGRIIASSAAFFLEDEKDLAMRNGLKEARAGDAIPLEWLSPIDAARAALFEDMIANHDWSMRAGPAGEECCHNFKLLGVGAPGMTVAVPYDFDFSGLVGDPNALAPEQLHIGSVRERVYRGYCAHNAEALTIARQMRGARPQLTAAITSIPGLDSRSTAKATAFLDGFFADIASDDIVTAKLLKRCVSG